MCFGSHGKSGLQRSGKRETGRGCLSKNSLDLSCMAFLFCLCSNTQRSIPPGSMCGCLAYKSWSQSRSCRMRPSPGPSTAWHKQRNQETNGRRRSCRCCALVAAMMVWRRVFRCPVRRKRPTWKKAGAISCPPNCHRYFEGPESGSILLGSPVLFASRLCDSVIWGQQVERAWQKIMKQLRDLDA